MDNSLSIRLPKTSQELSSILSEDSVEVLHRVAGVVYTPSQASNVVMKVRFHDNSEEASCTEFAHQHNLPVPRVLHHTTGVSPVAPDSLDLEPGLAYYIAMERLPGVRLSEVIETMSADQLNQIASQLKDILERMRSIESPTGTFGSVTGGPYRNSYFPVHVGPETAFPTSHEFIQGYRNILNLQCTEVFTDNLLSPLPRDSPLVFTHGDLVPLNIMVDGSTITGIFDWETGGFYPEYWEYARMRNPHWTTPSWESVLGLVFPDPEPQAVVDTVSRIVSILVYQF